MVAVSLATWLDLEDNAWSPLASFAFHRVSNGDAFRERETLSVPLVSPFTTTESLDDDVEVGEAIVQAAFNEAISPFKMLRKKKWKWRGRGREVRSINYHTRDTWRKRRGSGDRETAEGEDAQAKRAIA